MNEENISNTEAPTAGDTAVATRDTTPLRHAEPAWNARRDEGGVELEIALPGVRKDAVSVEVVGRFLHLEARRAASGGSGRLVFGEAAPDVYRLRLRLAEALDGARLEARLENGLLKVRVPLTEAAQPRKIEVL